MNILYCGDSNIEKGLLLSLLSIVEQICEPLHIYIMTLNLHTDKKDYAAVSDECVHIAKEIVQGIHPESTVHKIDVSHLFSKELPAANLNTRFTPCCMLRLYADTVEEIPDKILYLDNDVLCRMDFSDFYHQSMDNCEFVGVLDHYGSWFFRKNLLKRDYVNSGVLLLNMKMIRDTKLFAKCRQLCQTKKMFMPDQSALNKLSTTKRFADRRFNEQRRLQKNTVFQHFTTHFCFFPFFRTETVKPWQFELVHEKLGLHEYDDLFEKYHALHFEKHAK